MRLSIVMPTYNGMKYLNHAVNSILSQNHQDWELVISDDTSTDGTRDFLGQLRDPRIKIHFQAANLGIFGNLNFLFSKASCDITQILCQDDYFVDPGSLDRLLSEWSKLPQEIAYLRCNHLQVVNSNHERFEGEVLPSVVRPERSDLFFYIFGCIPGNLSNVSVRTKAVERSGWFRTDLPYAGDFEFWSRLGRLHPWAITKTSVAHARSHEEQASRTMNDHGELLPQIREILERLYQNLAREGHSPTLLRLEATINYVSRHRDIGVKSVLKGRGSDYLREVSCQFDSSSFSFGPAMGWVTYFASLGGRFFSNSVARRLIDVRSSSQTDSAASL